MPMHTRRVEYQAFHRADGLWDIEVSLVDVRPVPTPLESGVRAPNVPVHEMGLRVTIDDELNVREAAATMVGVPYPGFCGAIAPDYSRLAGLNLLRGFRKGVHELFGHVHGCTHLNELLGGLPTAAIQAMFRKPRDESVKPFQLDHCHALATDGEAVARYYPKWYAGRARRSSAD